MSCRTRNDGLDVERQRHDDAVGAEPDDERVEVRVAAAHLVHLGVGTDVAEARGPMPRARGFASPEPCVPVAVAPPTLMCGSEPMLRSAQPRSSSQTASTP